MSVAAAAPPLNKDQKLAFAAAWLGWAFDGLDGFLYTLIAIPFVTSLSKGDSPELIKSHAALIQGVFLVGWALGGAFFGRIGDKLGRSKTLTLTILTYAIFTGMHFFATAWWHLLIFRFIAALGIGGEWAAGSALVTETLPERFRHWGGALLQSAYMVGQIMAAGAIYFTSTIEPRWVFLIGVLPALVTVWFRRNLREPEVWAEEKAVVESKVSDLFRKDLILVTILTSAMASIALTVIWGVFYYHPQVITAYATKAGMDGAATKRLISQITVLNALFNIVGNFACMAVFKRIGVRFGLTLVMLMGAISLLMYSQTSSLMGVQLWGFSTIFFVGGLFALFPIYLPPLFPTMIRTTGAGLCYNIGRVVSGIGTFYAADWARKLDGAQHVMPFLAMMFIPGVFVAMLLPHMKGIERRASVPA